MGLIYGLLQKKSVCETVVHSTNTLYGDMIIMRTSRNRLKWEVTILPRFMKTEGRIYVGKKAKVLWMIKVCILPVCHAMERGPFLFVEIRRDIRLLTSLCSTKGLLGLKDFKQNPWPAFPTDCQTQCSI